MSTRKSMFMESTEIPVQKTAGEILSLLVRAGATQVSLDYQGAKITGMRFTYPVDGYQVQFCLPVRVDPVFKVLNGRRPPNEWRRGNRKDMAEKDREQAERVAWRQLLRWIEAQLAMIETGMVRTEEVFLPYAWTSGGRTLFEEFMATGNAARMLPAPEVVR